MKWTRWLTILPLIPLGAALTPVRAGDLVEPGVTLAVREIKLNGAPSELLLDQGKLYVSSFRGANLSVIDLASRRRLHELHLDAYESVTEVVGVMELVPKKRHVLLYPPGDLVAANGKLFVGQIFSDFLVVFDLATMWVVKRIPIEGEGNFAAAPDGKTVYFASNKKNEFYAIDTETYRFRTVRYPEGGRGIGSIALSPDGKRLYLGIQRGGRAPDGREHAGGNCFLAVYDLTKRRYAGTLYLAQILQAGESDDGVPDKLLFSSDGRKLYAGMFQSLAGIYVIDPEKLRIERNIAFSTNPRNRYFNWVDPIGLATYQTWLLAANRNNRELVVLDGTSYKLLARMSFAEENRGIAKVVVAGDRIYFGDGFEDIRAVYELNGRGLARALRAARVDAKADNPLEITLRVVRD
jgi:outer membrane protein assembly factor BamB